MPTPDPKPPSASTFITTAEGDVIEFAGAVAKFGAAHPRLLAALSGLGGIVIGFLAGHL